MKPKSRNPGAPPRPTFTIACWLMALIAFAQLISVGAALATRKNTTVPEATTPAAPRVATPVAAIQPRTIEQIEQAYADTPLLNTRPPTVTTSAAKPETNQQPVAPTLPTIANPRVERLVQETRKLHLAGDMMRAMLKLEEAARIDPTEPAVIYQKGILYEEMGIYTKAADQYQQIQQIGLKAGVFYRLAARKLTKGMDTWRARLQSLAIGPMKIRHAQGPLAGKKGRVSIPLLARPDKPINPEDVEVQVHFYDKLTNGKVEKASPSSEFIRTWTGEKIDWQDAGNEETLVVDYTIPQSSLIDDHLLGSRKFYGCVVELIYKGEIIDQQASPRHLNSIHGSKVQPIFPDTSPIPWLPSDDDGLLPSPQNEDPGHMPLPTR